MEEAAISRHFDELTERDYNRTKAGLGSSADPSDGELSRATQSAGHPGSKGFGGGGGGGDGRAVAQHYNSLADRHRTLSSGSEILHLRNLNNWIKSVLIAQHMKSGHGVLDLGARQPIARKPISRGI